jgi:hypothetical protein
MIAILSLIISLTTLTARAQSNASEPVQTSDKYTYQQPEIPNHFNSKMDEYIFFDNNFNVVQRLRTAAKAKENLMSDEDKKPVEIKIFVADIKDLNKDLYMSRFIARTDLDKVQSASGKMYIPYLASNTVSMRLLKMKFGEPQYTTRGRKVLSRATYYIEPVGPTGGFFAKFVPNVPGYEEKLKREILANDYIKSQLSQLPEDMRTLTMDSFMTVNLSLLGVPFSVAYRSANRILEEKENFIKTYPGHGLLGCDVCIEDLAMKYTGHNTTPEKAIAKWKKEELIPKLARYMAYTNHALGISLEAHTQNMIFDVNTQTGKIKFIYFRDFADDLLSILTLIGQRKFPLDIDWNQVRLLSVHGNLFSDPDTHEIKSAGKLVKKTVTELSAFNFAALKNIWGAAEQIFDNESPEMNNQARDIWIHSSIYSGQGITSHVKGFPRQQYYLAVFLKAYIAETERIIGEPIVLSEDAQRVLQNLEQKTNRENFYSGEITGRSPLRNAMASVLKSIFDIVFEKQIAMAQNQLAQVQPAANQKLLSKKFNGLATSQRVVFFNEDAKSRFNDSENAFSWYKKTAQAYFKMGRYVAKSDSTITIKIYDNRLWAVDRFSEKILAVSIDPITSFPSLNTVAAKSESPLYPRSSVIKMTCEHLY